MTPIQLAVRAAFRHAAKPHLPCRLQGVVPCSLQIHTYITRTLESIVLNHAQICMLGIPLLLETYYNICRTNSGTV